MNPSNEEASQSVVPNHEANKLTQNAKEEVFHTSNLNDQQVTKGHGIDAVIDDEGDVHGFDELLDVDSLCRAGGLPYPFHTELVGAIDEQSHLTNSTARDKAHIVDVEKEIEAPNTSTTTDFTSVITKKEVYAPNASIDAAHDSSPPLNSTFMVFERTLVLTWAVKVKAIPSRSYMLFLVCFNLC